ncbi:hypothetical protein XENOCAPTIV_014342 [Xenoophorus captivus]|uniref:Uncharacterized protein n=1 Tax=Xenoophorus captivus TaxID=1517983 RepID=A0ABV0SFA4_9TELE
MFSMYHKEIFYFKNRHKNRNTWRQYANIRETYLCYHWVWILPRHPGKGHKLALPAIIKQRKFKSSPYLRIVMSEPESLGLIVVNQGTKHAHIKNRSVNASWTRSGVMYLQI